MNVFNFPFIEIKIKGIQIVRAVVIETFAGLLPHGYNALYRRRYDHSRESEFKVVTGSGLEN
jgi:hypothetical protein